MIRRSAVALMLACLAACARPSTHNATAVLHTTAADMGQIRSGDLSMRFETFATDRKPSGFTLDGPFSLRSSGDLPVAKLDHTRFDGSRKSRSGTFVSTGRAAYIVRGDSVRRVPNSVLTSSGLSDLVVRDTGDRGLGRLDIDSWIDGEPKVTGAERIGGVASDKVTAKLDTTEVINGLIEIARSLGSGAAARLQPIPDSEAQRVSNAVRSAVLEVWTGQKDHLLRKLDARIVFGSRNQDLTEHIKQLSGATIRLRCTITKVNEPVKVQAPTR